MFECPSCKKPNNIYATTCQHCGAEIVRGGAPATAAAAKHDPCAKCGHGELLIVSPVTQPDVAEPGNMVRPAVIAWVVDSQVKTAGGFRAHVCMSCGYTEWYATDLATLAQVAGKQWNTKRVQATVSNPYR